MHTISSNGFSNEDQIKDAMNFLRHQQPEKYSDLVREFPDYPDLVWEGSSPKMHFAAEGGTAMLCTKAGFVDVEYMSWLQDAIEAKTTISWNDGEPWYLEENEFIDEDEMLRSLDMDPGHDEEQHPDEAFFVRHDGYKFLVFHDEALVMTALWRQSDNYIKIGSSTVYDHTELDFHELASAPGDTPKMDESVYWINAFSWGETKTESVPFKYRPFATYVAAWFAGKGGPRASVPYNEHSED